MNFPSGYELGARGGSPAPPGRSSRGVGAQAGLQGPAEGAPTPFLGIEPDFKLPRAPRGISALDFTLEEVGPPWVPGRGVRSVKTPGPLESGRIETSLPGPSCEVFVSSHFLGFGCAGRTGLESGLQPGEGGERGRRW